MTTPTWLWCGLLVAGSTGLLGCDANETRNNGDGKETVDTANTGSSNETITDSVTESQSESETFASGCEGIDFLFIIDNSGSMEEEQSNLMFNFPKVVEVLDNYQTPGGSKLTYRLGVTTSSVQRQFFTKSSLGPTPESPEMPVEDGLLLGKGICGLADPWVDGPGDDVANAFSCMADVGIDGWGYEMPLLAMEKALGEKSAPGQPNFGFYEKDGNKLLVVVVLTDEDDCSVNNGAKVGLDFISADPVTGASVDRCDETKSTGMIPVDEVKTFLDDLTGGEGRYVFVGIAGPAECESEPDRMCSSAFGEAYWAKRLDEFIDLVGAYGFLGDIGSGDLWGSLEQALDVVMSACDQFGPV